MRRWLLLMLLLAAAIGVTGCGDDTGGDGNVNDGKGETTQRHPDVLAATATRAADGTLTFEATLSSPYDTPERYADAWRVLGPDGEEYGVRELLHDHATEQPFTRSLPGVEIPDGVETVTIEGRDLVHGWGGATVELEVP